MFLRASAARPELKGVWHEGVLKADKKNHGTPAIEGQGGAMRESRIAGVYAKSTSCFETSAFRKS